jgi:phytanoyl-CoA hydroxylase
MREISGALSKATNQLRYRRALRSLVRPSASDPRYHSAFRGDVLIWSADLAHGGSAVTDPALTRNSLVGHLCPKTVEPFYFKLEPDRRATRLHGDGLYASQIYGV